MFKVSQFDKKNIPEYNYSVKVKIQNISLFQMQTCRTIFDQSVAAFPFISNHRIVDSNKNFHQLNQFSFFDKKKTHPIFK